MNIDLRVAELLCTRLCHDLTGPIGAVNNGAEFLSEEGFNMQNQAVELIVTSAFSAVSRLQFYRFAYGRVKDGGEASLSEKKSMAVDYFKGSKIELNWADEHTDASGVPVSSKMVRLIFNLLIIVSGCLLKGGKITVTIEENSEMDKVINIKAEGTAIKWEEEQKKLLSNKTAIENLSAKDVQYHLTRELLAELNMSLTQSVTDNEVVFNAVQLSANRNDLQNIIKAEQKTYG